jgi:spoIIIJ-associated protein
MIPKSLEFKGKNVEQALEKASAKLKVPKSKLKYDIISYGSSGIFGLAGSKKARIRVNRVNEDKSTESNPAAETNDRPEIETAIAENDQEIRAADMGAPEDDETGKPETEPLELPPEALEIGRSVLQRIIDVITSDAHITVQEDADRIQFNVAGGNPAILIGKRGQTLEAIQSIVEKVVNKQRINDSRIRVLVDVEGYLETRKENLEQLANRLAEKAQRIKKPISMGQMSAHDRRIVHLALKDNPKVSTKSRGEGYLRKLVIFPKRSGARKRKNRNYKNG